MRRLLGLVTGVLGACSPEPRDEARPQEGERREARDPESARLVETRTVYVRGEIDERLANEVIAKVLFLRHEDAGRAVTLQVDSPGGDAVAMLAILDTLQEAGTSPVHTACEGQAVGVAAWLVAGGAKGQRRARRGCQLMLWAPGTDRQVPRVETALAERMAAAVGRPRDEVLADMRVTRTLSAEEALAYGLIDAVDP